MEFNKEIFETEDDYLFEMSTCAIHKILMENQPCTTPEILAIANKFLPSDMLQSVREQLVDVYNVGVITRMLRHKHNVYVINESGINEYYFVLDEINREHRLAIEKIERLDVEFIENGKIVKMV